MKNFGSILIMISAIVLGFRIGMDIIALTALGILILGVWLFAHVTHDEILNLDKKNKETNMQFVEKYRGYEIYRAGDALNIYDDNGSYVERIDTLIVRKAELRIDEIIDK